MFQYTETYQTVQEKVRQFDRANDFPKRDEYLRLLDLMEFEGSDIEGTVDRLETELMELRDHSSSQSCTIDSLEMSLATIKDLAASALDAAESWPEDITDHEYDLLDALAKILKHTE